MFELASRLVGVYKVNHMVSRLFVSYGLEAWDRVLEGMMADLELQTKSVTVENRDYIVGRGCELAG